MTRLTEYTSYADAQKFFSSEKLWELFDGDRQRLNIAHECVDRYAASKQTAVIVIRADGPDELISYQELSQRSSQVAHFLQARGVEPGDRVAVMLEPSLAFYASIFGIIKAGAIAVPLFTLFGPDGLRLRLQDCSPALLITNAEKMEIVDPSMRERSLLADASFMSHLDDYSG